MAAETNVVMYGTESCGYCAAARMLLKNKGVNFDDILVSNDDEARIELERRSGQRTVPQVFINDEPIGGFDELYALEQDGHLDALLEQA